MALKGCLYNMYTLIDAIEFLLQSSFRNSIKFYYNWIVIMCIVYVVWWLGYISWAIYVFWYVLHPMA
jgi:hypothetical protein